MAGYRIEADVRLSSDWLPDTAFTRIYESEPVAVALAIEGVDDPGTTEVVRVVDIATGEVTWRSTEAEYE